MKNTILLENYIKYLGLKEFGFAKAEYFSDLVPYFNNRINYMNPFEESDISKRVNPMLFLEEGRSIISIAFPYYFEDNTGKYGFSLYTRGRDYHFVAGEYLNKICKYINSLGEKAVYFADSNSLPERYIGVVAGIGFIGRNSMLINKRYGSYIFLGEIITSMMLPPADKLAQNCKNCRKCIDACPSDAIKTNNFNLCQSYLTQKKNLKDEEFDKFTGNIFGCDICQKVCPFNNKTEKSNIQEFYPYSYMEKVDIKELINLDNKSFEKYKLTSAGWRGKNILTRNALINAVKFDREKLPDLNFSSPYIKDYYCRLFKYFKL